ncbi:hypothetical protein GKQ38_01120 [Candidatus Nanohaloarchaea archaeon]|nr:hypothetical protein GKQ38_01120 [Candidatus Nanohaloarchaea archaeon]
MVGSPYQGRESIEKLVQEEELPDLSDFSYREGLSGDRDIIYEEDSMKAWLSAEYSLDLSEEL